MDQVITFDKSLQTRLQEYTDVLSGHKTLSVSQLKKEWTFYLELWLDPNGWQGIWKIPRMSCEQLKISFPTIVLVYVECVDFVDHLAAVEIIAVQDDISLPDKYTVPLIQLWPTKLQDSSVVLNLKTTANSLDMLRFFYTNVFMPWDVEEDDTSDWFSTHLESRLRLFYDMKNGVIPRGTGEHLRSLLTEARRLQTKKEIIEKELEDDDGSIDVDPVTIRNHAENNHVEELMDLHVRILQIKGEVEILENPLMRNILIRRQNEISPTKNPEKPSVWLIFEQGSVDDHLNFLNKVKEHYPLKVVKFAPKLATTLESIAGKDSVILAKGSHLVRTTGGLENGGLLKGLYEIKDTLITSNTADVMLDFSGDNVVVENLTINVTLSQCAVLVRRGTTTLRNCHIIDTHTSPSNSSTTRQGIIVLSGAHLSLDSCQLTGFCAAVIGNSGSRVSMNTCVVTGSRQYGVKVYEGCVVKMSGCVFNGCGEYGVCVERDAVKEIRGEKEGIREKGSRLGGGRVEVGGFEVLKELSDVTVENTSGERNGKGNVIITNKQRIQPVLDLFTDSNKSKRKISSSTISDDDMECGEGNRTVIENTAV